MKNDKQTSKTAPKRSTVIIRRVLIVLFIAFALGQIIKFPARTLAKLQIDDIEKVVMHQDGFMSCHYGSWEIEQEEAEEVFDLVQAAARNVATNYNPYNFVYNLIENISQFIPHGGPGRGPILSFVTKSGREISVGVWYDCLELNNHILLTDKALCDAIEAFNLKQVDLRTAEIAAEKARIETLPVSDVAAMDIILTADKTCTPTPQEREDILYSLSQSLATNTITDKTEWRVENYVSYYVYQFLYYERNGNEIPIQLECLDGETFIAEVGEEVIILNGLPYRIDAEINASLYQMCQDIYSSALS